MHSFEENKYKMAFAPIQQETNILARYDITGIYAQHLNKLAGFKIVCICDDSTSMRERLGNGKTRWDELKQSIEIVLDIGSAYNVDCDVLFLNRPGFRNVKHISQLSDQFMSPPTGLTPLAASFQMAIENNRNELVERKLLIIIFTDGSPTSNNSNPQMAINEFKHSLQNRNPIDKIFITIVACTDDEYALEYLNNWDKSIKNLDVVDDYESERKEIYSKKKSKKDRSAFSYGDYIVKIILGSFVKEIDQTDEKKKSDSDCTLQ
jgi:hypothetical protein